MITRKGGAVFVSAVSSGFVVRVCSQVVLLSPCCWSRVGNKSWSRVAQFSREIRCSCVVMYGGPFCHFCQKWIRVHIWQKINRHIRPSFSHTWSYSILLKKMLWSLILCLIWVCCMMFWPIFGKSVPLTRRVLSRTLDLIVLNTKLQSLVCVC